MSENELINIGGKQQVKVEFIYSSLQYSIIKLKSPVLFALETSQSFNIISLVDLFADKLTTVGPYTIGIGDDRKDEQFKQIYDIITLFLSNRKVLIRNSTRIKNKYIMVAKEECLIRKISYNKELLYEDMINFIKGIQKIEESNDINIAYDFQSLYLRRNVTRDKQDWAIVGYQLQLIVEYIFSNKSNLEKIDEILDLIDYLYFSDIKGPERGVIIKNEKEKLRNKYGDIENISRNLFNKKLERIIWELLTFIKFDEINTIIYKDYLVHH